MTMKCKNCGKEVPDNFKYCPNCGTPVNEEGTTDKFNDDTTFKAVKYHYGFSYVRTLKILYLVLAIFAGIMTWIGFNALYQSQHGFMSFVIGLIVGALLYWFSSFSIKKFENIAITTKTIVEIRNELLKNKK